MKTMQLAHLLTTVLVLAQSTPANLRHKGHVHQIVECKGFRTVTQLLTTLHSVPAGGPFTQFGSAAEDNRSGVGIQIGRTQRLNINGVLSFSKAMSFIISEHIYDRS